MILKLEQKHMLLTMLMYKFSTKEVANKLNIHMSTVHRINKLYYIKNETLFKR